jgi:hypothetical protein
MSQELFLRLETQSVIVFGSKESCSLPNLNHKKVKCHTQGEGGVRKVPKSVTYYLNNLHPITFKINLKKTACSAVTLAQTKAK